jgi:hypothetical protein
VSDAVRTLRLAPGDNVVVLVGPVAAGAPVALPGAVVPAPADLGMGHKLACAPVAAGERVVKYGAPIGRATRDIAAGEHVHLHNLASEYTATHGRGG